MIPIPTPELNLWAREMVRRSPEANDVFRVRGPLTTVEKLERDLTGASRGDKAADRAAAKLIEHILRRYHEVHRQEFPAAIELARTVERVHAGDADCPRGLADHLAIMADDLEGHQRKEENILFPTMLAGSCGVLRFPIARMMSEHDDVHDQLARLAALTKDFTPPQEACHTWRALTQACKKLDRDLREHMRLENDVLFPHFL
ncbi:MAG: hemerythrin domain-containing protein [Phenylobacterium sp.]|uniref:hemerythrin domain-containing protein n=1 Tax=Phenylobacterium sp. TaxID=1871053 RepID=UPI003BB523E4